MYLPSATMLNKVAKTVKLKHPSMDLLFRMKQAELDRFLSGQYKALVEAGNDPVVAQAYQMLAPMLAENEAISEFVETTGDISLRAAFPEILSKAELIMIADQELMLTEEQKRGLARLLR